MASAKRPYFGLKWQKTGFLGKKRPFQAYKNKIFINKSFKSIHITFGGEIMVNTSKKLLPLAAMEKILKQAGADRVSDKAKVALKEVVEEKAEKIASDAIRLAAHAGRKTIKGGDIKLAAKKE